jgi:hypothetical protein
MADERESEAEEAAAAVERMDERTVDPAAATLADEPLVLDDSGAAEPVIVRETEVVEQTPGDEDEGERYTVTERVTEVYPASMVETAPDMESVPAAQEVDEAATAPFVVVERQERVMVEEAAGTDAPLEAFTTLQAITLAFLVLLNIIVIGLGIWQVSRYFGWL